MTDSTNKKTTSDASDEHEEDIASDFFDDFTKEEFMEGLNVIDSWNDDATSKTPNTDSQVNKMPADKTEIQTEKKKEPSSKEGTNESRHSSKQSAPQDTKLDEFIKPGSRRDPAKTNAAILKDKEVKVKNHLAKHLDPVAGSDLCPPGTELDDFFENQTTKKQPRVAVEEEKVPVYRSKSRERQRRELVKRRSPRPRRSPFRGPRSPNRGHRSPHRDFRPFRRASPFRPHRRSPRRSPRRTSPYRSRRSPRHSWSPVPRKLHRTRSISRERRDVMFASPHDRPEPPGFPPAFQYPGPAFPIPEPNQFAPMPDMYGSVPMYPDYGGYGYPPAQPPGMIMPPPIDPGPPAIPPDPQMIPPVPIPPQEPFQPGPVTETPYDALEKLVEEGKLSKEDYLKLTPNKGANIKKMEEQIKLEVLKECAEAVNRLSKMQLPKTLTMKKKCDIAMLKPTEEKYSSPLKRQLKVEYEFTQAFKYNKNAQQNQQIINTIISSLDLEEKGIKPIKTFRTPASHMKDASVQTTTPFCDVCAVRESVKYNDAETCIDQDAKRLFCSTVHTQVVEQDLLSSKTIFNPSGSSGVSPTMSIAHMTPAQLVSQLAARAKTLKQNEHSQQQHGSRGGWRNSQQYHYDGRGPHNSNYKYF